MERWIYAKIKVVKSIVAILITMPIWFYLLHSILVKINASELEFFLFWVYVPCALFVNSLNQYYTSKN